MARVREFEDYIRRSGVHRGLSASALLITIICLIAIIVIWAALAEVDDITRADGRVIPSRQIQMVQAADGGVLEEIHIREGVTVDAGDLLLTLDRTLSSSQFDQSMQRAVALRTRISRLQAQISGEPLSFAPELLQLARSVVAAEQAHYQARMNALAGDMAVLESQREQRLQELASARVSSATAEQMLAHIGEEIALVAPLVRRRMEPETSLLSLRRIESEWRGRLNEAHASIPRLDAALLETTQKIEALQRNFRAETLSELASTTAQLAELEPSLPALGQRVTRTELRAPVRGVVNRVMLTTLGGVAQAGQALVEIVPLDETLQIEAYVKPSDIAFIHANQRVKVKITAYEYSRYGALNGRVTRIAAGASPRPGPNPNTGVSQRNASEESVFIIEARTEGSLLDIDGRPVDIIPGMIAEVDIIAGRRTILNYLMQPVIRVRDRAFRD